MKHLKQPFVLMLLSWAFCTCTAQAPVVIKSQPQENSTVISVVNENEPAVGYKQQSLFDANFTTKGTSSKSRGCNPGVGGFTAMQNLFIFDLKLQAEQAQEARRRFERAQEVAQDNEYTVTGKEQGFFVDNPLMLDGQPLDYGEFTLYSVGELTVIKKAPVTGRVVEVPFYIFLRRDGVTIPLPGFDQFNSNHDKVDLSQILKHARAGDQLIIEAVNEEDGAVKRILKLLNDGC